MILKELEIFQFRNLQKVTLSLSEGLNFIIGRNGQGKTNLVEAIHILSTGRSFRTSTLKNTIHWDCTEAAVAATLQQSISDRNLRVILKERSREYHIDGKRVRSLVEFVGTLVSVSFAPDDLRLIRGGPVERRKFIDKHIVDATPSTLRHFTAYQRALKHKNALLKAGEQKRDAFTPWNEILIQEGYKIAQLRKSFLELLQGHVREAHGFFSARDGLIQLNLQSDFLADDNLLDKAAVEDKFAGLLPKEIAIKRCLLGAQRDDLIVRLNDKESKSFASQGQVRSIVLALKLGVLALLEQTLEDSPVILLDDVDSELDEQRSEEFFDLLLHNKRQVLITGTAFSEKRLNRSNTKVFTVREGSIHDAS